MSMNKDTALVYIHNQSLEMYEKVKNHTWGNAADDHDMAIEIMIAFLGIATMAVRTGAISNPKSISRE